ncbi:MAG: PLD nuclease N-terminal domain-containing protein [Acidimicrobiia bacterium]|nr:PLD nuclease N-terminal domain-containing protein [Acidimicrobiia bacterium]
MSEVSSGISWAAVAPLLILAVAFVVYCWVDMYRNDVKHLPKWAWAIITAFSIPIGGIVYLVVGRENR